MTDPLRMIGTLPAIQPAALRAPVSVSGGAGFGQVLMEKIAQVDRMQREADKAVVDLAAGRGGDPMRVIAAKQKADAAFNALLQVHDTLQRAYAEVQQVRV